MDKKSVERKIEEFWDFEVFQVISYSIENTTKASSIYKVLKCPDWVNVLALTEDGEIIFVEQFRHGLGQVTLELPGGLVDTGSSAVDAARQELLEESGYAGGEWILLGKYLANAGLQNNYVHSYFCKFPKLVKQPDPTEGTKLRLLSKEQTSAQIYDGSLAQAFSLATFHLAASKGLLTL